MYDISFTFGDIMRLIIVLLIYSFIMMIYKLISTIACNLSTNDGVNVVIAVITLIIKPFMAYYIIGSAFNIMNITYSNGFALIFVMVLALITKRVTQSNE